MKFDYPELKDPRLSKDFAMWLFVLRMSSFFLSVIASGIIFFLVLYVFEEVLHIKRIAVLPEDVVYWGMYILFLVFVGIFHGKLFGRWQKKAIYQEMVKKIIKYIKAEVSPEILKKCMDNMRQNKDLDQLLSRGISENLVTSDQAYLLFMMYGGMDQKDFDPILEKYREMGSNSE